MVPHWEILDPPLLQRKWDILRLYCQLRHRNGKEFWRDKIEADQSSSNWKFVDVLLGRGRVPASSAVDAEAFNQFFADKVANIHRNTSGAPPPTFSRVRSGVSLDAFRTND